MQNLTKNKTLFHAIIERDVQKMEFGTLGYTIFIDMNGDPKIDTLKVNKSYRKKYGK